tara:strand:+ start:4752 stop:5573 length:822 start_codon:yes stop_codon:yes gene_type:complete
MPNYTVKKGDTLSQIARANGYSLSDVMAANKGIDYNRISIGQEIALPYGNKPPVNYDAFGSVINKPDSPQDYVNTSRAKIVEPPAPINTTGYNLSADIPVAKAQRAEVVDPAVFSNRLIDFLKEQEGEKLTEYLDLGEPAIGYGHNLTEDEIAKEEVYGHDVSKPISKAAAKDILRQDLENFTVTLDSRLFSKHGVRLSALPEKSREMLLDLEFNLGDAVGKFPTFTEALVNGDMETAKKEYERGYYINKNTPDEEFVSLTRRNTGFFNTFLN